VCVLCFFRVHSSLGARADGSKLSRTVGFHVLLPADPTLSAISKLQSKRAFSVAALNLRSHRDSPFVNGDHSGFENVKKNEESSGLNYQDLGNSVDKVLSSKYPAGNSPTANSSISKTIQDILSIASDNSLSDIERIQLIRSALPAPIFPYETEPGMMGETRVAKSFGHLNDLLFLDSWAEHSDKLGPCKLYRGVPDSSMELLTSLQRLVEPTNHIKSSKAAEMGASSDAPAHLSLAAMKRIEQVAPSSQAAPCRPLPPASPSPSPCLSPRTRPRPLAALPCSLAPLGPPRLIRRRPRLLLRGAPSRGGGRRA
jgi:hypothetical protein